MGRSVFLVCTVAAVLGAAGCGEGDESDDIASRGSEICRELGAKAQRIEPPRRPSERAAHARELRIIYEQALADFRELEPPEDEREQFDEFLVTLEALVTLAYEREGIDEFTRTDHAKSERRMRGLFTTFGERATALGLEECLEDS